MELHDVVQTCTSAGWDGVLAGLMNDEEPGCNSTRTEDMPNGDCGNAGLAVAYLVTYLIMTFLVVINMYIAVILENFSQVSHYGNVPRCSVVRPQLLTKFDTVGRRLPWVTRLTSLCITAVETSAKVMVKAKFDYTSWFGTSSKLAPN